MRDVVTPLAGTEAGGSSCRWARAATAWSRPRRRAVVFEELQAVADRGVQFSVLSEEVGLRSFGAPSLVVDPVDGSLNAKQGIPFFNVMMALLEGSNVGDATVGCVVNIVSGERWTAIRAGAPGAAAAAIAVIPRRSDRIQLLGLEARPARSVSPRSSSRGRARSILRAMALSMAHGRGTDAFYAPCRCVFDMTAGLLLLSESGVATDVHGRSLESPRLHAADAHHAAVRAGRAVPRAGARAFAGD